MKKTKKILLDIGIGFGALVVLGISVYYFVKAAEPPENKVNDLLSTASALLDKAGQEPSDENGVTYAQQANANIDQALAIDPTNFYALADKGEVLVYLGKYNEAITYFDKILSIYPNNHFVGNLKNFTIRINYENNTNQTYVRETLQQMRSIVCCSP